MRAVVLKGTIPQRMSPCIFQHESLRGQALIERKFES